MTWLQLRPRSGELRFGTSCPSLAHLWPSRSLEIPHKTVLDVPELCCTSYLVLSYSSRLSASSLSPSLLPLSTDALHRVHLLVLHTPKQDGDCTLGLGLRARERRRASQKRQERHSSPKKSVTAPQKWRLDRIASFLRRPHPALSLRNGGFWGAGGRRCGAGA